MTSQSTLGELTTRHASAAKIFHAYGLDYCCGGKQTLQDACREKNLDPEKILTEIQREHGDHRPVPWEKQPLDELIDHILSRYHEPLREELPRLIDLAAKIEEVHADKPDCPKGLNRHLVAIADAVSSHLAKEEQLLFPLIKSGELQGASDPIQIMTTEHEAHGRNLQKTRALTKNFFLPAEACASWRELYRSLDGLEKDLMDHIHLENNILFPRALQS